MADVSLASLALRLAVSMGVVIGLMLLAAKLLRRAQAYAYASGTGKGRGARSGGRGKDARRGTTEDTAPARRRGRVTTIPIEIGSIAALSRNASVAIVRAAGRELVVGVTETQVTLLHSAPQDTSDTDAIDLDGLHAPTVQAVTTTAALPSPTAARIAADGSDTPDRGAGLPAWTDALETLRAMTVRR